MDIDLRLGSCLDVLKTMEDNSVDSIVTDPPYGLSFMGNKWDYDVPSVEIWRECLRVLKHGGHLLAFSGTRTYHRMVVNIEDAGFEIRDCIQWLYGSGFPKSLNISKAIDKAAGAERKVVGKNPLASKQTGQKNTVALAGDRNPNLYLTKPATPEAEQWDGWGTALKPANEPICLARKPLIGTVAKNVLEHGTGGMNIDGCRVGEKGRWPANVIHDGSDEAIEHFPETGSPSRYFYCAKANQTERNAGCDDRNNHPTVKPISLMRYLSKLITKEGGIVLDPFMGSGTTGIAACLEGFNFVGIELDESYLEIARHRIAHWGDYQITESDTLIPQKRITEWL